ncbi:hypothetical protein JKF63_01127 [Porcisia hertigi]|uniref:Uncharacterized protein n=1 Tax=Porcisia hertigi TaxID=2761500 RepID=A0A836HJ67_9TRYP|nr:hypothetical protein JKF63_01127 [Porcisia hertigi]
MKNEGAHADGSSQRPHMLSGLRKLFQGNSLDRSKMPHNDWNSPVGGNDISDSPDSAQDPEELEDHMHGSIYARTDICQACGFPRGSSVCCPVSRRHHGTDEVVRSGGHHTHSRCLSSTIKSVLAKEFNKIPVSPCHLNQSAQANFESRAPTAEELPPPLASVSEDAPAEGADGYSTGVKRPLPWGAGDFVGQESDPEDHRNETFSNQHNGIDICKGNDGADGAACQEGDDTTQYYCYTDENGCTYYYAQVQEDPKQQQSSAANAEAAHTSPDGAELSQKENHGEEVGTDGAVPPGSYVCECVDENGQTVYYMYTPDVDGADDSAATALLQTGDTKGSVETPASTIAVARSEVTSEDAGDTTGASKRKMPGKYFAAILNSFKFHRKNRRRGKHVDPAADDCEVAQPASCTADRAVEPSTAMSAVFSDTLITRIPSGVKEYDKEVKDFMELLDEAEKKGFMKKRKRLIKELVLSERKEREAIMKQRHDGLEALERERRAGAVASQSDEAGKRKRMGLKII